MAGNNFQIKHDDEIEQNKERALVKVQPENQTKIYDLPKELIFDIFKMAGPSYRMLRQVCMDWELCVSHLIENQRKKLQRAVIDDLNLKWTVAPISNNEIDYIPFTEIRKYSKAVVFHQGVIYMFSKNRNPGTKKMAKKLFRYDAECCHWLKPILLEDENAPLDVSFMFEWNGHIVCLDGFNKTETKIWTTKTNQIFLFNPQSKKWIRNHCPAGPGSIKGYGATLHGDRLVVFGGSCTKIGMSNTVWCLDMLTFKWQKATIRGKAPPPRYGHLQVAIDDNHVLVMGGRIGETPCNDGWLLYMAQVPWMWKEVKYENTLCRNDDFFATPACKVGDKLLVFKSMSFFSIFYTITAAKLTEDALDLFSDVAESAEAFKNLRPIVNITKPTTENFTWTRETLIVCDLKDVFDSNRPGVAWYIFKNFSFFPGFPPIHTVTYTVGADGKIIVFGRHHGEVNTCLQSVFILQPNDTKTII